ncbi:MULTISPECIES: isopenicillin N synthase family oxygenase [unclassified Vibrio]|uniref:2-oxoglutarate-dependent ethylene/succinate-forming enzyme n=1 Tax=Vibrio sp. HB236076 TaxID=3232307 RepID=A0AB39HDD9_9VIBR|nr:2-oxoglutarate and iron-dependent oxygenase domain-containing protein [Vibrio sp. HB161653]MDP5253803.1 2-oxoglutarate and iron-dependent oxygenase domain-containing protein [Vibrio sp. HB161653]
MSLNLPIIDISALQSDDVSQWTDVISEIDKACRDIGFFYVIGHGIPREQFDQVQAMADRFFALPESTKQQISIQHSSNHRGWGQVNAEQLDPNGPSDHKETFDMALDLSPFHPQVARCPQLYGPNQYPHLEGFIQLMQQQYQLSMEVALRILKAMALALSLPMDFFSQYFTFPISVLRCIHYPPQTGEQNGAGAHTDYGCITLLYQDTIGGLQVQDRHGHWLEAPPVDNSFVVNIGDLMQRWTNDCYKSTSHRVTSPSCQRTRFSMPFFVEPNFDTPVKTIASCITKGEVSPYPEVTAGDWILSRFADTYEYRAKDKKP